MATHGPHNPIHTNGLADNCEKCDYAADHPFEALDDENLTDLIARTRRWMDDDLPESVARSRNEHKAMRIVETALVHKRALDRLEQEAAA